MLFIEVNPQPGLVYEKPILREGFFAGQACQIFVFNYLMLTRLHERFLALGSYSYFYNFSTSSLSSSTLHQSHYLDGGNPTHSSSLSIHFLMSAVYCIYYATWQNHLWDSKILGSQHMSSPYTKFPISSYNNQAHISKTMNIFPLPYCIFFG